MPGLNSMIRGRTFRTKHQESISYIVHIWVWGCGFVILLLVSVSAFCWQFFAPYFQTFAPNFPCTIVIILYFGSSFPLGDTFVCYRWIVYVQNGLQLISQFALVSNFFPLPCCSSKLAILMIWSCPRSAWWSVRSCFVAFLQVVFRWAMKSCNVWWW